MPKIYAAADVTIAASCGHSARDSFLESWTFLNLFRFDFGQNYNVYVAVSDRTMSDIEPLDTRAWALQETFLSERILDFQTKSLVLGCSTSSVRIGNTEIDRMETYYVSALRKLSNRILSDKFDEPYPYHEAWRSLVVEYSQRHLTLPDERLLTISGLANRFALHLDSKYLAGIWQSALPRDLLWYCVDPQSRPRNERAPTWSWAAIDSSVSFNVDLLSEKEHDEHNQPMRIHDISVISSHPDAEYGVVKQGGYICVSGFMRRVTIAGDGARRVMVDAGSLGCHCR